MIHARGRICLFAEDVLDRDQGQFMDDEDWLQMFGRMVAASVEILKEAC